MAKPNDSAVGSIFAAVGLLYGTITWFQIPIGSAISMGPGYFPMVLALLLIVLGFTLIARSFQGDSAEGFGRVPWRPVIVITGAIFLFAFALIRLGMPATVFLVCFVTAFADREMNPVRAIWASTSIALLCTAVFIYAIGLPLTILGTWLR